MTETPMLIALEEARDLMYNSGPSLDAMKWLYTWEKMIDSERRLVQQRRKYLETIAEESEEGARMAERWDFLLRRLPWPEQDKREPDGPDVA